VSSDVWRSVTHESWPIALSVREIADWGTRDVTMTHGWKRVD
jgi:hypothetical protein